MSDGRTHAGDSLLVAAAGAGLILTSGNPAHMAALFAAGSLAGVVLSPDLDADHRTISEAVVFKIPLLGYVFQWVWYPYAIAIPHRHWTSHMPVIGTAGRVAYLMLWWWIVSQHGRVPWEPTWLIKPEVGIWLAGLATSDLLHWIRDKMPKRKRKKRRKRRRREHRCQTRESAQAAARA